MASVQEPGIITVEVESPSGNTKKVLEQSVAFLGPGGSPDGVVSTTPEKLQFIQAIGGPDGRPFGPGFKLKVYFTAVGADGVDISDCVWKIPITNARSGIVTDLQCTSTDFNEYLTVDYTTVANHKVEIARRRIPEGEVWYFGGGLIFMSIEDDTA